MKVKRSQIWNLSTQLLRRKRKFFSFAGKVGNRRISTSEIVFEIVLHVALDIRLDFFFSVLRNTKYAPEGLYTFFPSDFSPEFLTNFSVFILRSKMSHAFVSIPNQNFEEELTAQLQQIFREIRPVERKRNHGSASSIPSSSCTDI